MTIPATFTQEGARRIVNAVRDWEQSTGQISERQPVSKPSTQSVMLVKTPSTLSIGYDGSTALNGSLVERNTATGNDITIASSVWIKALNGEPLTTATVYHARFAGTFSQSGTTKPFYLVDSAYSSIPSLEYVLPWKWVDVTFNPPLYGSSFTQKGLLYSKIEQSLNPKSGSIPDLGNMEAPGEDYWIDAARLNTPDLDTTPYYCVQSDPLPVYSDTNTAFLGLTSSTYYEGATAAAYYLKGMGFALPKVHSKFSLSGATVAKYGGGTLPIYANDDMNAISYGASPADVIIKPFLATVKYISMSGVIWGVTSTAYSWKNSSGTTKDLYFWFWDGMGLLANSGADQEVLVTPITKLKMNASFTDYESSGKTNGDVLYLITNKF